MENNSLIKNNIEKIIRGEYTDFLDPSEYIKIVSNLNKYNIKYKVFKPFDDCTKVIMYKDKYPEVSLIEIKTNEVLRHSDILGTLFAHNINISKYGDIIVRDNHYYIIVLDSIKKYLLINLDMISKNKVHLEEVPIDIISDYHFEYEELHILVSSLRLDNLVSRLTNSSRNQTDILFKDKYILVNYVVNNKKTYLIKEKDIISIRKYGKYLFDTIIKKTSKNKYILRILKYK